VCLLREAGYWDDPKVWRLYGDRDGNYATIGNQQSRPEAALVEKVINSVDARLMNECLCRGIDPTSQRAPQSIRQAVARFFEQREVDGDYGGTIQDWTRGRRKEESERITLAATGAKRRPCLTIVDQGEGQSPDSMPETFLSIDRSNKLRIPFVQGKFNMGGTGALKYCGHEGLQLIITRRNPRIVKAMNEQSTSSQLWGVTVVRRQRPGPGAGAVRNSVYTYLAPVGCKDSPGRGGVLRFTAPALPLMPHQNQPYVREIEWGSAVKLYNYDMKGFASHILMKDGLLFRLEALLPEIALPVRLHECRDYGGAAERSFATTLAGLTVRLEEGRGDNLEEGFPDSVPFKVNGQSMVAKIYAFKKGKAETYRTNEGVIFTVNGQTHGAIPKTIFQRSKVKMGRLADSLLVTVDCSEISVDAREDLFMNSRDRLSSGELRKAVENTLEDVLRQHPALRSLRDARRNQEIEERLKDSKPLEEVLDSILRSSPTLAALFLRGTRLSQPHRAGAGGPNGGKGGADGKDGQPFVGKPHPTYFRFEGKHDGEMLNRKCEFGRRCRLAFETDVENQYFIRPDMPGRYDVEVIEGRDPGLSLNHSLTLHNGLAHWSIEIPDDVLIGDKITLQCNVADDVNPEGFANVARLTVQPQSTPSSRGKGGRRNRGSEEQSCGGGNGDNGTAGLGSENPSGIAMPTIIRVRQAEWEKYGFDKDSACKIVQDEVDEDGHQETTYTFYVNVDNICLRTEMKHNGESAELLQAKFVYGNVLVGLALINDHSRRVPHDNANGAANDDESGESTVEGRVKSTSKALAPFMIPMINYLGALTSDDVAGLGEVGDNE